MAKKYKKEEVVSGLIDFIKEATHEGLLSEVVGQLEEAAREGESAKIAYIYTFFKLTDDQKEAIKKKLEKQVGHEINLREVIDRKLLAGFKIKLGDWVYDASLKGQLESFKNEIYANI